MSSPETTGSNETEILPTELPDVIVRDLDEQALPDLKKMFEENLRFFAKGGIPTDEFFYEYIEKDVQARESIPRRRMGIWKNNALVGYVSLVSSENPSDANEVEVSFVVDPAYERQGIAHAAVQAVVDRENDAGHNVVAEANLGNHASQSLLNKLQFEYAGGNRMDSKQKFVRNAMTIDEMMRRLGM